MSNRLSFTDDLIMDVSEPYSRIPRVFRTSYAAFLSAGSWAPGEIHSVQEEAYQQGRKVLRSRLSLESLRFYFVAVTQSEIPESRKRYAKRFM